MKSCRVQGEDNINKEKRKVLESEVHAMESLNAAVKLSTLPINISHGHERTRKTW